MSDPPSGGRAIVVGSRGQDGTLLSLEAEAEEMSVVGISRQGGDGAGATELADPAAVREVVAAVQPTERVKRKGLRLLEGPFRKYIPAASYFPTQLPTQYHRRCRA